MLMPNRICTPRLHPIIQLFFLALLLVELSACAARVGPRTLPGDRFDYSGAITRSMMEILAEASAGVEIPRIRR